MTPLYGHINQDTAYLIDSYPYGGLRCKIRFWLESNSRGFRFVSQTENPKTFRWNNPKKSTYSRLAACMFLDDKGHVVWKSLNEYSSVQDVQAFIRTFPNACTINLKFWCKSKVAHSLGRAEGKIQWKIGGVVQSDSAEEIQKLREEVALWQECVDLISKVR